MHTSIVTPVSPDGSAGQLLFRTVTVNGEAAPRPSTALVLFVCLCGVCTPAGMACIFPPTAHAPRASRRSGSQAVTMWAMVAGSGCGGADTWR